MSAFVGDASELLRELEADSVDCVVTSPPYWNLRDYGVDGQIGLEPDPVIYIARLVEVFHEVFRVLAPRGVMFVNMGDSYCASRSGPIGDRSGLDGGQTAQKASRQAAAASRPKDKPNRRQTYPALGVKNKDLMGMPWRLAFALQQDGWRLRQDIVWSKPNPMPESVKDRPTRSHEYVFLFTKSERYFWNGEAIAEPVSENTHARLSQNVAAQVGSARANGGTRPDRPMKAARARWPSGWANGDGRKHEENAGRHTPKDVDGRSARLGRAPGWRKLAAAGSGIKNNESMAAALALEVDRRNARSVWTINTEGYSEAHYATFPRELARRCVLAGTPEGGTVLDPFVGSGTTLAVCVELGRRGIGFDLDGRNLRFIERRVGEALLERTRERPEDFDSPIAAVGVSDLGPLWEDVTPIERERVSRMVLGRAATSDSTKDGKNGGT